MTGIFKGLQAGFYDLIVIDPPWDFEIWSEKGIDKTPQAQYQCSPMEENMRLPVCDLAAKNCLLLMWATAPLLDQQTECLRRWGFQYTSALVWHKVFRSGKNAMGLGFRVRSMAEFVLIGTRGKPKHKPFPGLFKGVRRQNSRKPQEFYDLVEAKCPDLLNRADIFARQRRRGWDSFGDELDMFPMEEAA